VQANTADVIASKTVTVDSIHSRHIYPPAQSNDGEDGGIPVMTVVASTLASFLGSLVIAAVVSGLVICKIKGDAEKVLERSLATLLLSLSMGGGSRGPKSKTGKGESVNKIVPKHSIATMINEGMDSSHDGKVDFEEFSAWAKKNNITDKQTKVLWQDLDENHNNAVTRDEWHAFVDRRPHLKFLVGRLGNLNK